MITLALSQMIYFFCLQAKFTGAEDGLQGVPRGVLFGFIDLGSDLAMYYATFAIFMIGFLLIYRTVHSPFGQVLKAIRENEARALSLGYDVDKHKLLAFVLSTALAGLAGRTKTIVLGFETLTDVNWPLSGEVVLMTLIGGIGTIFDRWSAPFSSSPCKRARRQGRLLGAGDHGRDLRDLRARLPPRHRRRVDGAVQPQEERARLSRAS